MSYLKICPESNKLLPIYISLLNFLSHLEGVQINLKHFFNIYLFVDKQVLKNYLKGKISEIALLTGLSPSMVHSNATEWNISISEHLLERLCDKRYMNRMLRKKISVGDWLKELKDFCFYLQDSAFLPVSSFKLLIRPGSIWHITTEGWRSVWNQHHTRPSPDVGHFGLITQVNGTTCLVAFGSSQNENNETVFKIQLKKETHFYITWMFIVNSKEFIGKKFTPYKDSSRLTPEEFQIMIEEIKEVIGNDFFP